MQIQDAGIILYYVAWLKLLIVVQIQLSVLAQAWRAKSAKFSNNVA